MGFLLDAFGVKTLNAGDFAANVTPPSRATSPALTVDRALTLPAVFRSIQLLAGIGSQLTIDAWRGDDLVNPAPSLVTNPDPWRSLPSFLSRCIVNAATDGNNFLLKHRGPLGNVVAIEALNPFNVTIRRDARTHQKSYDVVGTAGKVRNYAADEIEHVWALEVPGHDRGLAPIGACRAALSGALTVREYADGWFENPDVPSGVLSSDQRLDAETAKFYKGMWINPTDENGDPYRAGPSVRVLGQGLAYAPTMLKPEEAQWLQAQNFGILDVARMFGVPADYLLAAVEGNSLTYSNLEMIDAQCLRTTLFPLYLTPIEAAISNILPRGQVARFRTEKLLRPDAKTRAEIAKVYIDAGVLDPAEVRAAEGWTGPPPKKKPAPAPAQPVEAPK